MANGIGKFTARNILAILVAARQDGMTYRTVAARGQELGADVSYTTLTTWLARGRADSAGDGRKTAYQTFAEMLDHCMRAAQERAAKECGDHRPGEDRVSAGSSVRG